MMNWSLLVVLLLAERGFHTKHTKTTFLPLGLQNQTLPWLQGFSPVCSGGGDRDSCWGPSGLAPPSGSCVAHFWSPAIQKRGNCDPRQPPRMYMLSLVRACASSTSMFMWETRVFVLWPSVVPISSPVVLAFHILETWPPQKKPTSRKKHLFWPQHDRRLLDRVLSETFCFVACVECKSSRLMESRCKEPFFLKLGDLNRHEVMRWRRRCKRRLYFTRQQPQFHAGCSSLLSRLQFLPPPHSQIIALLIALFHPCYGLLKETLAWTCRPWIWS